ncbi:hypothetical protein FS749_004898 [Ceratobasidium sp. UAMH 11750]|nr:hypothetical protein FS749_004898 [Ceratobasidium sp. UAMH 11750]
MPALHQAIDRPHASSVDWTLTEAKIVQLYKQMGSVETIKRKVSESRALLHRIINGSTTLVPVNALPPELLCRVFELTIPPLPRFPRDSFSFKLHPLAVIPSVCIRWHRITITACSLWSYIDIGSWPLTTKARTAMLKRVQTWLERARGAPLHLNFRGKHKEDVGNGVSLAATLQSHMAFATSLVFWQTDYALLQTILSLSASCSPGPLTSLVVDKPDVPIHTDTHLIQFAWPMSVIHGIAVLQLIELPKCVCPSLDELVSILANSPHLHTLQLRGLQFGPDLDHDYPDISLPSLRTLNLHPMNSLHLQKLLSALVPGSHRLDVRMDLPNQSNNEGFATIQVFFSRSNVTHLFLWDQHPNNVLWLARCLDCLPGLQVLGLDFSIDEDCDNLGALTVGTEEDETVARCPRLQALHVVAVVIGSLAQRRLKQVVECHRLREMQFGFDTEFVTESAEDMEKKELFGWLRLRVERVVHDPEFFGPYE